MEAFLAAYAATRIINRSSMTKRYVDYLSASLVVGIKFLEKSKALSNPRQVTRQA